MFIALSDLSQYIDEEGGVQMKWGSRARSEAESERTAQSSTTIGRDEGATQRQKTAAWQCAMKQGY